MKPEVAPKNNSKLKPQKISHFQEINKYFTISPNFSSLRRLHDTLRHFNQAYKFPVVSDTATKKVKQRLTRHFGLYSERDHRRSRGEHVPGGPRYTRRRQRHKKGWLQSILMLTVETSGSSFLP